MRAAPAAAALAWALLVGAPAAARAQIGSPWETPNREVVQELGLQEEVFPQERGALQWEAQIGVNDEGEEPVVESEIELELGVIDHLEIEAGIELEHGLDSGRTGLGRSTVGALWGPVDEPDLGVSLAYWSAFPARSGIGEEAFSHEASLILHGAIDRVHAQIVGGVEVQHGIELEELRQEHVRVDPQAALALWVHLDTVAIVMEGAAEPTVERIEWRLGPTLLWSPADELVLMGHGHASLGGPSPLYEAMIHAVLETQVFR